ncbi:MAG TPA: helix-turn-helix domain-containing protein [Candidatus Saccharimonadales bacterium]|nr:helix-turn-helix domain-containing protein [Candidatus Saccharimonadales bacterium]
MKTATQSTAGATPAPAANPCLLEPRIGCIAAAMEIIGNKWTALILRDLAGGPKRFSELERSLRTGRGAAGISPRTLSQRMDDLEGHGIISKHCFAEAPPRSEYRLTDKGHDLLPILKQMAVWGEKYYQQ